MYDSYRSSPIIRCDVKSAHESLSVKIQGEAEISYRTRFIGTRRVAAGTSIAPEAMGIVLEEQEGLEPRYTFTGEELYVRAKIIFSKVKANPYREGEYEVAWTQPVVLPH